MGLKEKIKNKNLTKKEALEIIKQWKKENPHINLDHLKNWVNNYKPKPKKDNVKKFRKSNFG